MIVSGFRLCFGFGSGVSAHFPFSEFADMSIFRRLFDVNFFGYGEKNPTPKREKTTNSYI